MLDGGIHGSDERGNGDTMKKRRRKYIEIDEENEKKSMDENLEEGRHRRELSEDGHNARAAADSSTLAGYSLVHSLLACIM
jgi:hypothetical protein